VECFARTMPDVTWQPSEYVPHLLGGVGDAGPRPFDGDRDRTLCQIDDVGCKVLSNVLPAVALDASQPFSRWPEEVQRHADRATLVFVANVTHISPWPVSTGILSAASKLLAPYVAPKLSFFFFFFFFCFACARLHAVNVNIAIAQLLRSHCLVLCA
jgi:hypothetical protein